MRGEPTDLLDVNVWLALADADHAHHSRARRYWEEESQPRVAFCRVSMLGFLRLSTNIKVLSGRPFTPEEAWRAYRQFSALPEVCFLTEPARLEARMAAWSDMPRFPVGRWTDCYLAAFAHSGTCRLVSFDGDYHSFREVDFLHLTG